MTEREKELRLQLALDAAGCAVWEVSIADGETLQGTITWSGDGAALLGLPPQPMVQPLRHFLEHVHVEDRERVTQTLQPDAAGDARQAFDLTRGPLSVTIQLTGFVPKGQAILRSGIVQYAGRLAGVDIDKENLLFKVSDFMILGDISKLKTVNNGIILGEGLADKIGTGMNDNINVIAPNGTMLEMKIVGINRTGLTEVDKSRAYVSIRNAQRLLGVDNSYITDINIKLKDITRSDELSKEFEKIYGYHAEDWKEANANIFGVFKIQNLITYLIIISILIVSGFGIFNILMMIIYEKMPDIAILKAVGFKDRDIRKLFLTESIVIGAIGGIAGLVMGFILTHIIGSIKMDIKGFVSMEYLKFNSSPLFYIFGYLFALVVTTFAGYIPARKASKIDPIDIIRAK